MKLSPAELLEQRRKQQLERNPDYQRRKGLTQEERSREAIDFMLKDAMKIARESGVETTQDAERRRIENAAYRADRKKRQG